MYNPPDPESFNQVVWEIVRQIPAGKVSTYGQIASMIPAPPGIDPDQYARLGARWVGNAMHLSPTGVPWQRVINSQGEISLRRDSTAADEQRFLLETEGVGFDLGGRVDFEIVGWDGPPQEWLDRNKLLPPRSLKKRKPDSDDSTQLSLF